MMEVDSSNDVIMRDANFLKTRCLSPGIADQHSQDQLTGLRLPVAENGFVCNQSADTEGSQASRENSQADTSEILPRDDITTGSSCVDTEDDRLAVSESVSDSCSVVDGVEPVSNTDISRDVVSATDDHGEDCNTDISHDVVSATDDHGEDCNTDISHDVVSATDDHGGECNTDISHDVVSATDDHGGECNTDISHDVSATDDHGEECNTDISHDVVSATDDHGEECNTDISHDVVCTTDDHGEDCNTDISHDVVCTTDDHGEECNTDISHDVSATDDHGEDCNTDISHDVVCTTDDHGGECNTDISHDVVCTTDDHGEDCNTDISHDVVCTTDDHGGECNTDISHDVVSATDDHGEDCNTDNSHDVVCTTDDHGEDCNTDISHDVVSATDDHGEECKQVERAGEDTFDDLQNNHVLLEEEAGGKTSQNTETSDQGSSVAKSGAEGGRLDDTSNVNRVKKSKCDVQSVGGSMSPLDMEVICLDEDGESKDNDSSIMEIEDMDCQNVIGMKWPPQKIGATGDASQSKAGKGNISLCKTGAVATKSSNDDDSIVYVNVDEDSRHSEKQAGGDSVHYIMDDEKENKETCKSISDGKEVGGEQKRYQKMDLSGKDTKVKDNDKQYDSADDEVEIIGESKVVQISQPNKSLHTSQNIVFVPSGLPLLKQNNVVPSNGGQPMPPTQSATLVPSAIPSPAMFHKMTPGNSSQRMPTMNPNRVVTGANSSQQQQQQKLQLMFSSVAPPKPQSSLDQIELIRWEIQNRINTRPKYFKPNPSAELGSLAKFLFDIGSDLTKEAVYHDLVKIQSKKKNQNKLNDKEKADLGKLKEIEKDLYAIIGHLKLKLRKKCGMCDFRTESINVMFQHNQHPHEDSKGMRCSHCSFTTKQGIAFKFHMETTHGIHPRLYDKKATFECELCPYENNHEQKLNLHKQRCIKQFRPYFNLHPSCLSGAEINLCLENIFYKPIVPKNLHLQQKQQHLQAPMRDVQKQQHLQAPMTDVQKQQAEIKSIAAQSTAAALAARKQLAQSMAAGKGPRYNVPANGRMSVPAKVMQGQPQPLRIASPADIKGQRSTVASMLNHQQISVPPAPPAASTPLPPPGIFEVCEICGGFVKDRKALRIHFFYAHRIDLPFNLFERNQAPLYCATCYVRFWTAQGLRKHIDSHKEGNQSRGVVGKCIMCSHHVLNLLLHMRLVHNRDMQHYMNLNMCMFCGLKTLSREECEKHIVNIHGQVDPIGGTLTVKPPSIATNQPLKKLPQKTVAQPKKAGNTSGKRCFCALCNLEFSRNVDLTRHCMRMHHTCMKCGMVVADKPSLLKHVCLMSSSGVRDCVVCGDTGYHPAYYVKHLRDKHLRKLSIKVARLSTKTIERWTKHQCTLTTEPEAILVEISDDDDDTGKQPKSPPTNTAGNVPNNARAVKLENNNEEPADSDRDTNKLADEVAEKVEVIEIDTAQELNVDNEDNGFNDIVQGHKRKSDSPTSETSPKRQKTP